MLTNEEVDDVQLVRLNGTSDTTKGQESGLVNLIIPSCEFSQGRILMFTLMENQSKFPRYVISFLMLGYSLNSKAARLLWLHASACTVFESFLHLVLHIMLCSACAVLSYKPVYMKTIGNTSSVWSWENRIGLSGPCSEPCLM